MVAPRTTLPAGSVTTPLMEPVSSCAAAGMASPASSSTSAKQAWKRAKSFHPNCGEFTQPCATLRRINMECAFIVLPPEETLSQNLKHFLHPHFSAASAAAASSLPCRLCNHCNLLGVVHRKFGALACDLRGVLLLAFFYMRPHAQKLLHRRLRILRVVQSAIGLRKLVIGAHGAVICRICRNRKLQLLDCFPIFIETQQAAAHVTMCVAQRGVVL